MSFFQRATALELIGVYQLERKKLFHNNCIGKYDSISLRLSGEGSYKINNQELTVGKGDLLYVPARFPYTQYTQGESVITILFRRLNNDVLYIPEVVSIEQTNVVENLFHSIYTIWGEKREGYRQQCMSLFYQILSLAVQNEDVRSMKSLPQDLQLAMQRSLSYIHAHFLDEEFPIDDLCRVANLSEDYFRKTFKKICDVPPYQYILQLKLEYAMDLLHSGLYSVAEVCERSGFPDHKYFSRLFKKHYRLTPSEYKQTFTKEVE